MKRWFFWCITVCFLFSFLDCKKKEDDLDQTILGLVVADFLSSPYEKITPEAGTITVAGAAYNNRAYSPSCTGIEGNTTFSLYRKRVAASNKKLLINFMGGGACWSGYNCFGDNTTTYFDMLNAVPDQFVKIAFQGVMNAGNASNPFKDYDVVFIPYCTGDLHIGSKDTTYVNPNTGSNVVIKHHGYDNVLATMKFIQSEYPGVETVFVTGQSAGGYGALLNYPIVRETVTGLNGGVRVNMLSDASNGIVTNGFFANLDTQWGADPNIPAWVGTLGPGYLAGTPSITDYFTQVANEYAGAGDKLGQYTALFDGNQRFFYKVMNIIDAAPTYTDTKTPDPYDSSKSYSTLFGDSDGSAIPDGTPASIDGSSCGWSEQAVTSMVTIEAAAPNYAYYIAPGDVHTITTSEKMYDVNSGGTNFVTWLTTLASGTLPANTKCNANGGNCANSNLIQSKINTALGAATSDQSFPLNRNLVTACGAFTDL
ncbi:pectinacetylesterase [Leptospira gomenensis]|uniref:Pectinacetylesterase n=1 Tax=Leptospira gomenensis TaxID=2484974 RepID=A0A5F1YY02_9LEPT|nr:pectin acetylesterase-family hydrolase [Leptospira gomenensis]TGK29461.1 pectinacetylesterase [Leptospira gomenensis]TGK33636.1 pectinacetylesterase [Leptospira gomenensis]TGK44877.1 pectinacetylesterase [Leptospira gomenensis]TGK64498.1 pectinacetylesterase [Leptospira gomenensis]